MPSRYNGRSRILLVTPSLGELGGVGSYFKTVLPLLNNDEFSIDHLEVGSFNGKGTYLYPIHDQMHLGKRVCSDVALVHLNPSLTLKSFVRDGAFLMQAKQRDLPVVIFFRGWNKRFAKLIDASKSTVFRATYGRADAFIVLASEFEETLRKWGITKPIYRETTVVDPQLTEAFNHEHRMARIRDSEVCKVLYLARLEREKGLFETVEAVAALWRDGLPVQLSIAGDGHARRTLEDHIERLDLPSDVVRLLGYLRGPEKAAAFNDHDLYCLPTFHEEGMPNAVLEALAFGMPVITCAVGGLKDILRTQRIGKVVPKRDAEAIATAIKEIFSDKETMAKIAVTNRTFAVNHVLAPQVATRIQSIYRRTLAGR